jgi:hypothetical protein
VLAQAVDRAGTLILDADERYLDERTLTDDVGDGLSVIYTSAGRDNEAVDGHRARGGRCVLARDGRIVLTEGERESEVMRIGQGGPARGMASPSAPLLLVGPLVSHRTSSRRPWPPTTRAAGRRARSWRRPARG